MVRIGVTGSFRLNSKGKEEFALLAEYADSVEKAGGVPILLAPVQTDDALRAQLECVNGLLLSGGPDIPPTRYGQPRHNKTIEVHPRRDEYEFRLVPTALDMRLPILGICGGMQLINVALGGTLVQDIPSMLNNGEIHADTHEHPQPRHAIRIAESSRLRRILGKEKRLVNSFHHQAIDTLGKSLATVAWSEQGLPEAVEGTDDMFMLGVQWHPERMQDIPEQRALFHALVAAAARR